MSNFNLYRINKGSVSKLNGIIGTEQEELEKCEAWLLEYLDESGTALKTATSHPVKGASTEEKVKELVSQTKPKPEPKPVVKKQYKDSHLGS